MKACRWARSAERGRSPWAGTVLLAVLLSGAAPDAGAAGQTVALGNLPLETSGVLAQGALESAVANQALYLQTFVNGVDSGFISPYRLIGGSLYADAAELRQMGFAIDESSVGPNGLLELAHIPGLVYRLDTLRQVVEITVGAEQLQAHRYDASVASLRPSVSPGVVLNYDTYAQQTRTTSGTADERSELYSGLLDLRAFGSAGTLIQTGLFRRADPQPSGFEPALRLDTTLFRSDPERLDTWRAGDLISGGSLAWVTPVRLGGLQWQRNFRLQPNLVTFPVPTLSGSAAVPSTVDVLVNNIQQYSRPVAPGPFVIDNMPVITGQGEIRVVVRDALGREQVTTLPFYAAPTLLRPGLVDFSIEGGYLRRNYAIESDDYDHQLAGLGSMRTGLTDWLTIENHIEGTDGLVNGGAGGVFRVGLWGVLSASVAQSFASGASGGRWGAGYHWSSGRLGLTASTQRASSRHQTLANYQSGAPATREVSQASLSTAVGGGGLSLGYVAVRGGGVAGPGSETRVGTASYSLALRGKWAASTSLFREFSGDRATGASVGLAYFFGGRASASVAAQYREHQETTANVQAGRSLPAEGTGAGWRLQGTSGDAASAALSAGYRLASATVEAGAADNGDADSAFAALRGAVVGMDYRRWPMLTNSIQDSFALVDTGVPNVAVLHENRLVGRSNADSLLLIPSLTAQSRNQISIDARDVPLDAEVGSVREVAVPLDRSGVLVKFPVARAEHALVVLHTATGAPVPAGAVVTLNGDETFLVGYDGQAYLKRLAARNALQVNWGAGQCRVEFEFRAVAGAQQQIGPLHCVERAP